MNKTRNILIGFGVLLAPGLVILAAAWMYSSFSGSMITDTPSQAIELGTYVQTSHLTQDEANAAQTIADAGATTLYAQTDRYRAQTERMAAEDHRLQTLQSMSGITPGAIWVVVLLLTTVGLIALIVLRKKKHD